MMATGHSRSAPATYLSIAAVNKAGASLSIQFTVAPMRNNSGDLVGLVAVFQELKRLRAQASGR
jgi:hypothetical protein